jgi:hypothetical protein
MFGNPCSLTCRSFPRVERAKMRNAGNRLRVAGSPVILPRAGEIPKKRPRMTPGGAE